MIFIAIYTRTKRVNQSTSEKKPFRSFVGFFGLVYTMFFSLSFRLDNNHTRKWNLIKSYKQVTKVQFFSPVWTICHRFESSNWLCQVHFIWRIKHNFETLEPRIRLSGTRFSPILNGSRVTKKQQRYDELEKVNFLPVFLSFYWMSRDWMFLLITR